MTTYVISEYEYIILTLSFTLGVSLLFINYWWDQVIIRLVKKGCVSLTHWLRAHQIFFALLLVHVGPFAYFFIVVVQTKAYVPFLWWCGVVVWLYVRVIGPVIKRLFLAFLFQKKISRALYGLSSVGLSLIISAFIMCWTNQEDGEAAFSWWFIGIYSSFIVLICVMAWSLVYRCVSLPKQTVIIKSIRCVDSQVLTSLWPLAYIAIDKLYNIYFFIAFTVFLLFFYYKNKDIKPNFIFFIFGFHFYEVEIQNGNGEFFLLITKRREVTQCEELERVSRYTEFCLVDPGK